MNSHQRRIKFRKLIKGKLYPYQFAALRSLCKAKSLVPIFVDASWQFSCPSQSMARTNRNPDSTKPVDIVPYKVITNIEYDPTWGYTTLVDPKEPR